MAALSSFSFFDISMAWNFSFSFASASWFSLGGLGQVHTHMYVQSTYRESARERERDA
jgi:hypothetical protein